MGNKRGAAVLILIIVLILFLLILGYLIFQFYFGIDEELIDIPIQESYKCANIEDSYVLPDFKRLEGILANEQIVKDMPSKGKVSLKFYHFVEDCKKWDKIYLLRDGKIEERSVEADIDIWISSDYVNKIKENNLCDIIKEAKQKEELGQSVNISKTKLMWAYKSMLKHKECLGL